MEIIQRIHVTPDTDLERQGHNAVVIQVKTKQGTICEKIVHTPRGSPANPLAREEHIDRFYDCIGYAGKPLPWENAERILALVSQLEELQDVCELIPLLLSQERGVRKLA